MAINRKYDNLIERLKGEGSIAVAFSGGVDSTLLLLAAKEALGKDNVLAITAKSPLFPTAETADSEDFCKSQGIRQILIPVDHLAIEGFAENPKDRCYICKKALMSRLIAIGAKSGFDKVAEGTNLDDLGDYRPGLKAVEELGIISPLKDAGLEKSEIRQLLRDRGIAVSDKPSMACLASRFPYGETITWEKLSAVEKGEAYLFGKNLKQLRVRSHGNIARIETDEEGFDYISKNRHEIAEKFRELGFLYTALDLTGYRTGSMNDTININESK